MYQLGFAKSSQRQLDSQPLVGWLGRVKNQASEMELGVLRESEETEETKKSEGLRKRRKSRNVEKKLIK